MRIPGLPFVRGATGGLVMPVKDGARVEGDATFRGEVRQWGREGGKKKEGEIGSGVAVF